MEQILNGLAEAKIPRRAKRPGAPLRTRIVKTIHPRIADGLTVVRLDRTDWRVSSGSEAQELLGYIERQRGGRFEVLWMTDPIRWGYASSFDDAIAAFTDSARFAGDISAERRSTVA
jgi:hypothetical protein